MSEHVPEETLMDCADGKLSAAECAAVDAHVASCSDCRQALDDFRQIASALSNEETWWMSETMEDESRAMQELAERLDAEDAEAAEMLRHVLDSQYRFAYRNIVRRKRFRTGGVVRLHTETSRNQCLDDPRYALTLAEAAAAIAEALPDDCYPAAAVNELRGNAWNEYSTACRYLAQFSNGFDALNRAERAYRRLRDPGTHVALIDLGRAGLMFEQQRYDEALHYARSAEQQFVDRRETARYFEAKEVEAVILYRLGNTAAARETYKAAFDLADSIDDVEMKARAAKNLAIACRDCGDIGTASKYLLTALHLYQGLGQHVMVEHTRWSIACLALSAGNPQEAARRLPEVIAELERLGVAGDAARARLDLAEAHLLLGRFDTVEEICSRLVTYFRNAKMLTGALTAAAFLKEAAANKTLTRQHIQQVRTYLIALERAPDLPFGPPPQSN